VASFGLEELNLWLMLQDSTIIFTTFERYNGRNLITELEVKKPCFKTTQTVKSLQMTRLFVQGI
jgi:hypothetical protein